VRLVCGTVAVLAAAFLAGTVAAVDLPKLPPAPVPVPTPTLPALPPPPSVPPPTSLLPTPPPATTAAAPLPVPVPAPSLPAPTLPAPSLPTPSLPAPSVPAPSPSKPSLPAGAAPAGSSPTATSPSTPAPSAAARTSTAVPQPAAAAPVRLQPSATHGPARPHRIARPPQPRPIVARFHVDRGGRLHVRILELAPACRMLRGFTLDAKHGANTLRLPKRVKAIGTYLLTGHRGEHTLFSFRARLLPGRHVKLGGGASVCLAQPTAATDVKYALHVAAPRVAAPPRQGVSAAKAIADSPRNSSPLFRAITLRDGPAPLLFLLLALSLVVFTAAALPERLLLPAGALGAQIAARRAYLAAAGVWLLALAAVVATFA
jgi:hypothetical protein